VAPAEGRLRSQYWSLNRSVRWMRVYARYGERGNGRVRLSEETMVGRMRTETLRPSWYWSKQSCESVLS
jgi:hypothetical protein